MVRKFERLTDILCKNKTPNSIKYEQLKTYVTVNFIHLFWIYQSTVLIARCA